MNNKRIQVYTDAETKRRIELAAARRDVAVTQYCLEAIMQQLAEDDLLEREQIEIPVKPTQAEDLIAELRALQEQIKAERDGQLIDVDRALEQTREERDYELTGLC
jgi:uncharacterized protein (DUF1778 family)